MICKYVELIISSTEPRDIAKGMLKFWMFQQEEARREESSCRLQIDGCLRANRVAVDEWRNTDDCLGFSGPPKVHSDAEIETLRGRLPALQKHLHEANHMVGYMLNFVTDKAHPEQSS